MPLLQDQTPLYTHTSRPSSDSSGIVCLRGGKCGEWGTPFSGEVTSGSLPPDPVPGDGGGVCVKGASVSLGSTGYHKHDSWLASWIRFLWARAISLRPGGQAHELLQMFVVAFLWDFLVFMHVASPLPQVASGRLRSCAHVTMRTLSQGDVVCIHSAPWPMSYNRLSGLGFRMWPPVSLTVDINLEPRSLLALQSGLEASSEGGEDGLCFSVS